MFFKKIKIKIQEKTHRFERYAGIMISAMLRNKEKKNIFILMDDFSRYLICVSFFEHQKFPSWPALFFPKKSLMFDISYFRQMCKLSAFPVADSFCN